MRRTVMKSKIHRAHVTAADLHYEGSVSIDLDLLDAADIVPFEQIHVWDVTNGARIVTYAIPGERGSGVVQVNGGGAHLVKPGDIVIIATFTTLRPKEARKHKPLVVWVDEANRAVKQTVEPTEPEKATAESLNGVPDIIEGVAKVAVSDTTVIESHEKGEKSEKGEKQEKQKKRGKTQKEPKE